MGQKVHPEGFRVGYIHDWKSNWFNEREFADYLLEDIKIREHIEGKLGHAGLSDIRIRKNKNEVTVDIHTARPGIVIGKSGAEVDALRRELHKMTSKQVRVNILEVKRPELDAKLVAQSIAEQLQNRVAFRRAMKRALTSAMRSGRDRCPGAGVGPARRLGDGAHGGILRGPRAAAHASRRHRLRPARGADDLRAHRRQVLDQQGRGDARGLPDRGDARRRGRSGAPRSRAAVTAAAAARPGGGPAAGRPAAREGALTMLMPKRVKHRKQHRGRMAGLAKGGTTVQFGEYGLKALDAGWVTNRQIEAARIAMTRKIKRGGKVWINIFPDKPVTKKPAETRMGSGKGSPEGWVAVVKPGRVMFELAGVPEPLAREAMRLAGHKLPVRTKFVMRED